MFFPHAPLLIVWRSCYSWFGLYYIGHAKPLCRFEQHLRYLTKKDHQSGEKHSGPVLFETYGLIEMK